MKPVLIGLNNPYSDDPDCALLPYPERSAGNRLWWMYLEAGGGLNQVHYARAFDRRNLFATAPPWSHHVRYDAAQAMLRSIPPASTVILLGSEVRKAMDLVLEQPLDPKMLSHPQVRNGRTWRCLPHPSGRVTQYNDPVFRMLAGMVLADVLQHSTGE